MPRDIKPMNLEGNIYFMCKAQQLFQLKEQNMSLVHTPCDDAMVSLMFGWV